MIVTVRATSEARRRNLVCVIDWYKQMQDFELIVVEQDRSPQIDSSDWPYAVKRLYVVNDGAFNKGWGFNVGAKVAQGDILFFCDADLLVAHSALKAAISLCSRRALAVKPFDRLIDLNTADTEAILAGDTAPNFEREDASQRRGTHEVLCFCGGAFLMRKSLHHTLGGFDERYLGWGAEDDAMTFKIQKTTAELAVIEGRAGIHLWHERSEASTFGNQHYPNNLHMLKNLMNAPEDAFLFQRDLQRQIMGNPGKYETLVKKIPVSC